MKKKIAVLALQGAFIEHERMLEKLGAECFEIRQKRDLEKDFDGLVLPGGESTVQGKLLRELELLEPLREKIYTGMPVFGTCAGLILLAGHIAGEEKEHFATLPVTVKRNAYGRQLGSFEITSEIKGLGEIPMTFIRAPYVEAVEPGVEILAQVQDKIVAVRYENQLAVAFHPELTEDLSIHKFFLHM